MRICVKDRTGSFNPHSVADFGAAPAGRHIPRSGQ
jgi:hypothetical protein